MIYKFFIIFSFLAFCVFGQQETCGDSKTRCGQGSCCQIGLTGNKFKCCGKEESCCQSKEKSQCCNKNSQCCSGDKESRCCPNDKSCCTTLDGFARCCDKDVKYCPDAQTKCKNGQCCPNKNRENTFKCCDGDKVCCPSENHSECCPKGHKCCKSSNKSPSKCCGKDFSCCVDKNGNSQCCNENRIPKNSERVSEYDYESHHGGELSTTKYSGKNPTSTTTVSNDICPDQTDCGRWNGKCCGNNDGTFRCCGKSWSCCPSKNGSKSTCCPQGLQCCVDSKTGNSQCCEKSQNGTPDYPNYG